MSHLDNELKLLKSAVVEMWNLVINQLSKARNVIEKSDRQLVSEIKANEKRVDAFELKIDMDCENILALYNPVANDLRFVLAVMKINYNLERIGDYAKGIAGLNSDEGASFSAKALKGTRISEMFEVSLEMLSEGLLAFECEDNQKARSIFVKDELLDQTNKSANKIVSQLIVSEKENVSQMLSLLSAIRKLERVGDQTKNISEEIIFYIEAKVLKHNKKARV